MHLEAGTAPLSSVSLLTSTDSLGTENYSGFGEKNIAKNRWYNSLHLWSWIGQIALFLTSISFALKQPLGAECVEKLSTYSPVLSVIGDNYTDVRFNSTIFGTSPYIGQPSPELDKQWEDLVRDGAVSISHDELLKIGAPESSIKLPADSGGGYMAWLEVFHQVHCLHTLWQNSWHTYYNTTEMGSQNSSSVYRKHIDHCADNLRQKLLCDADVGLITFDWLSKHKLPVPNFNTVHKCRNLEAVWDWHAKNRAPASASGALKKGPNSVVLDQLP